ncbi:MAG: phosphatase PAP2 family protein [Lachnospiraceae bacterium]|nr:phosphatase PAP2 family protein [Lachnospiraceae bacterium]
MNKKKWSRYPVEFYRRYRHGLWIVFYMMFYMVGFMILENAGHRHYHVLHSAIDDMIPFCEYFIIPYTLWFLYMALGICWFVFCSGSKREYYQLSSVLAIGMTLFLIVSCVWPNMQDLRPEVFARENMFVDMVRQLYATDTPTNVLPSIHVYNSLALMFAFLSSERMRGRNVAKGAIVTLTILIVLSTMFLKQHSVVDVSMGVLTAVAVQMFCEKVFHKEHAAAVCRADSYKY